MTDNAYQALIVIVCPSCDNYVTMTMPTQEIYDGDRQTSICEHCQQELEIVIDIHIRRIDEPPF